MRLFFITFFIFSLFGCAELDNLDNTLNKTTDQINNKISDFNKSINESIGLSKKSQNKDHNSDYNLSGNNIKTGQFIKSGGFGSDNIDHMFLRVKNKFKFTTHEDFRKNVKANIHKEPSEKLLDELKKKDRFTYIKKPGEFYQMSDTFNSDKTKNGIYFLKITLKQETSGNVEINYYIEADTKYMRNLLEKELSNII